MPVRIADLAPNPPMGWNSFDSYGVYLDEPTALANMRVMAERLLPAGYRFFVIDMGWYSEYECAHGKTRGARTNGPMDGPIIGPCRNG